MERQPTFCQRAGKKEPDLVNLFTVQDGASLFGAGLRFVELGGRFGLARMRRGLANAGFDFGEGWAPFAVGIASEVAWACSSDGRVRGFGQDERRYGPNVRVSAWFADQVADLSFAVANSSLPWVSRALGT